jgi:hypothetical protein
MQKFIDSVTASSNGALVPLAGATVTVKLSGTDTLAAVFSDNGVTAAANPVVAGATGLIEFYAEDGRYDLHVAAVGHNPFVVRDILLEDPANDRITALSEVAISDSAMVDSTIADSAISGSDITDSSFAGGEISDSTATGLAVSASTMVDSEISGSAMADSEITGSSIDSSPVGVTSPHTGRFTSLQLATASFGAGISLGEMRLNTAENTVDVGLGNDVTGQMFEEAFISVVNNTGSAFVSGQVVGFAGVDNVNSIPYASLPAATPQYPPLFTIGVVTQSINPGAVGKVTTFGKVRNVNTTGFPVGEVWAAGDILYLHPTIPGQMTNAEPVAPSPAIVMAAVLRVGATTGTLLVRPLLHDRLYYGVFSSSADQTAAAINTPYAVSFTDTDSESGVSRDLLDPTKIVTTRSGLYNVQFSAQLAKTNSSTGYMWIWPRVNGVDVPNSATKVSIAGSNSEVVPAWNFVLPLAENSYFQLMYAVSETTIKFDAVAPETFCPAIPSVILTVTQANQ